ncbi:MAG: type 4a pilus biogenesis protein PilO [Verrucomicrobiae bacterium]|nr:type 4a pilus biogenesis protein PilO [Verrucomicrobiae bacterium]
MALITGVTVFVCVNYFAAGPLWGKWEEVNRKIVETRGRIAAAQSVVQMEPQWQAQHRELLTRLRQSGSGESAGDIIPRIESVASQLDISFSQRSPSPPVDRDRYMERSANFSYQGQWSNMIKFLFALTKQPEIYRVTALRMRADSRDPNQLSGDMKIVTYYLPGESSSAPAGAQKPAAAGPTAGSIRTTVSPSAPQDKR